MVTQYILKHPKIKLLFLFVLLFYIFLIFNKINSDIKMSEATLRVKKKIGQETYDFLISDKKYKKTIEWLVLSEILVDEAKTSNFFINNPVNEYSYLVFPADKAFEGALYAIVRKRNIISDQEMVNHIPMENIFYDYNSQPALAKKYVLDKRDVYLVNTIWNRYYLFRDKLMHYEPDNFVFSPEIAEYDLIEIESTIKLAYRLFIGNPDKP